MTTKGKNLDADGKAQLAEDLLSPCTEEIAVFQQFSRVVLEGRRRFVIVDTAPTGHTLLLLDTAGAYHRDMVRQSGDVMAFHTPLMLLQDPALTRVLIVTTAEPTPVAEAAGLQDDLLRAGIRPGLGSSMVPSPRLGRRRFCFSNALQPRSRCMRPSPA